MSFFFFQAEDGIRDHCVTGVQTCALPISKPARLRLSASEKTPAKTRITPGLFLMLPHTNLKSLWRSEERRVGKECSAAALPEHYKKEDDGEEAYDDDMVDEGW